MIGKSTTQKLKAAPLLNNIICKRICKRAYDISEKSIVEMRGV